MTESILKKFNDELEAIILTGGGKREFSALKEKYATKALYESPDCYDIVKNLTALTDDPAGYSFRSEFFPNMLIKYDQLDIETRRGCCLIAIVWAMNPRYLGEYSYGFNKVGESTTSNIRSLQDQVIERLEKARIEALEDFLRTDDIPTLAHTLKELNFIGSELGASQIKDQQTTIEVSCEKRAIEMLKFIKQFSDKLTNEEIKSLLGQITTNLEERLDMGFDVTLATVQDKANNTNKPQPPNR
jgi:hypothetical protein